MARQKTNKTASEIRYEIQLLQDRLIEAEMREAQKIGELALAAGLADVPEQELVAAFKQIAGRFRADANQ